MMYIPEYSREQIPEKDFFYNVLSTIYPKEVGMLIDAVYKARQPHYRMQEDEMIKMTPDIKDAIKSALVYKSKEHSQ